MISVSAILASTVFQHVLGRGIPCRSCTLNILFYSISALFIKLHSWPIQPSCWRDNNILNWLWRQNCLDKKHPRLFPSLSRSPAWSRQIRLPLWRSINLTVNCRMVPPPACTTCLMFCVILRCFGDVWHIPSAAVKGNLVIDSWGASYCSCAWQRLCLNWKGFLKCLGLKCISCISYFCT